MIVVAPPPAKPIATSATRGRADTDGRRGTDPQVPGRFVLLGGSLGLMAAVVTAAGNRDS